MGRADSPLRDRVIFLVGARRSGTNWLQRVLEAHPDVCNVPSESYLMSRGVRPLADRVQHSSPGSWQLGVVYMEREAFLDAVRDLCDRIFGSVLATLGGGATRLAERTPEHALHLGLIRSVYPDARVVHIIRDGRDVVRSLLSMEWGPSSPGDAAREWVESITTARRDAEGWDRYREVRYEALLADPATEVEALFDWLGLDRDNLGDALDEAAVRYNVDPQAPAVRAGKWRAGLTAQELAACESVAGPLLDALGYGDTSPPDAPAQARSSRPDRAPVGSASGVIARAAARAHRLALRAPGALRRRGDEHRGASRQSVAQEAQLTIDRFQAALAQGRFDDLVAMLAPSARVGVDAGGTRWRGRDAAAHRRLVADLAADPALATPPVHSDVHPGIPRFTVVQTHAVDRGLATRVFVLGAVGGRLDHVSVYRPAATGTAAG